MGGGCSSSPAVDFIEFDGEAMQVKAYNDFIDSKRDDYDFAAFFDCDEFLRIPPGASLEMFLKNFTNFYGVAVNWRIFGDSGVEFDGKNYSCITRFTRCHYALNRHCKLVLNMCLCKNRCHFVNPHFIDMQLRNDIVCDTAKSRFVHGPWNDDPVDNGIWLNHYFCKTIDEYKAIKMPRGKADTPVNHKMYFRKLDEFDEHNLNSSEDLVVKNLFLS